MLGRDTSVVLFLQAEDGIRDLVRSRGLGDVYKRQGAALPWAATAFSKAAMRGATSASVRGGRRRRSGACLLYTSDAADERSSVDLGGRRIIKNKTSSASRLLPLQRFHYPLDWCGIKR